MIKPWIQVVLAVTQFTASIALGFGLGLLSHGARAANDEKPGYTSTDGVAFKVCLKAGTPSAICAMKYTADSDALEIALDSLEPCPANTVNADCLVVRAYIRGRWGY